MSVSLTQNSGKKAGFTLIELLIVITIIAILALVAVSSYSGVQRQATVDFAADTLVATIREAEDWARSGRRGPQVDGEESKALCYAVKMVTGVEDGAGLYSASTAYISVENDIVDSCTIVPSDSGWRKSDVFNERITIIGDGETFVYYFKPPFGKIFLEQGGALTSAPSQTASFVVGDSDYAEWNKNIRFDLLTGEVKKVNLSE